MKKNRDKIFKFILCVTLLRTLMNETFYMVITLFHLVLLHLNRDNTKQTHQNCIPFTWWTTFSLLFKIRFPIKLYLRTISHWVLAFCLHLYHSIEISFSTAIPRLFSVKSNGLCSVILFYFVAFSILDHCLLGTPDKINSMLPLKKKI